MSIRVRRERPDQRRHHRVSAPLMVSVDGGPLVRAKDWGLGGLRIDDYPAPLPPVGKEVWIVSSLPFQGFDISFTLKGRVIRNVAEKCSFAVEYTEVGERERQLMTHFIGDLVRGVMSEVDESIQRIDVPVTPVSVEPDPEMAPVKRWGARQFAWTTLYSVAGFIVFGYMGLVIYSNLLRMEVDTAVVTAPLIDVRAQGNGELASVKAAAGDRVRQGETIIDITDYDLERQIDQSKIEIQRKEAELASLSQKREAEIEVMKEYASVDTKNIEQTKLDIDALEAERLAAQARVDRLSKLLKNGYSTKADVEEANQELAAARSKLASKRVEVKEQIRLAETGLGKRHFNGTELLGNLAQLDAAIALAEREIALARDAYAALIKHRDRLAVRAPFDGRLVELPRPASAPVKQGDVIAVFERDRDRAILAYVTQDEVMRVGFGDRASVYFPALNASLRARVVGIDRTKGFQQEIARRYSWRAPDDRSAEVTLAFEESEDEALKASVTPGLPAIVLFEARSANPILAAIWRKFAALFA